MELFEFQIAGTNVTPFILSLAVLFITFTLRHFAVRQTLKLVEQLSGKTKTEWDDQLTKIARKPTLWLVTIIGIWVALAILPLPAEEGGNLAETVNKAGRISIILIFTWFFFRAIDTVTEMLKAKANDPEHWMDTSLIPMIVISLKIAIGVLVVILTAQNLGYSVSTIVASLGIGGIAVALAAKDTLANFFGSLMIMMDQPFKLGQWVKAKNGDFEGVVEEIGFRSTKIRTFGKTVEIIPNSLLANSIVENMDRRSDKEINLRRVKQTIGLEYKASAKDMKKAVDAIRKILTGNKMVDQKQILVYFTDFGDSSLNILVYYFADTAWVKWLETKQGVNLEIMEKLEELGLAIAFPTRSIYLENQPEQKPALKPAVKKKK